MAFWGITRTDVANCGWNAAVGIGVLVGCEVVAFSVNKIAQKGYTFFYPRAWPNEIKNFNGYASTGSLAVGLVASYAAYAYLPSSRFALVTNFSTDTMPKLVAITTVAGIALHYLTSWQLFIPFSIVGPLGALSTRYTSYATLAFGAVGAFLGALHGHKTPKSAIFEEIN